MRTAETERYCSLAAAPRRDHPETAPRARAADLLLPLLPWYTYSVSASLCSSASASASSSSAASSSLFIHGKSTAFVHLEAS